ncbi:MAG: right-handed parallel beta-helix repeat-containing protein [Planctomycetes bacterium]|nr:right-handed parallel beta-helix repeat-containing protein [Planctomycetota bacterium]
MIRRRFLEQAGLVAFGTLGPDCSVTASQRASSARGCDEQSAQESAYVIFQEGGIVRGVNARTGKVEFEGKDARRVINETLNAAAAPGKTWKETVLIKGPIDLDLGPASWDPNRRSGIEVPNYTRLRIAGKITLVANARSAPKQVNYIVTNKDHKTGRQIEIIGGEIDGNAANNQHGIYGIQVSGATDVRIVGVYVHDCRETGVAFENVSRNCWAVNNHVVGRKDLKLFWQDGLGNQFDCHDIFYIGNVAERCRFWGIYIEGGSNIVALGNVCHHNGRDGIIVGSGAHPGNSISVIGNTVYENDQHGIRAHSAKASRGLIIGNIARNNAAKGGRHSGIVVNCRDFCVQGNQCWDDRPEKKQEYGIALLAGAEHCQVNGNNVRANKLGGVLLQEGATQCHIHDNQGYRTESHGMAKGSSPITIRHGLCSAPSAVQLTPRGPQPVRLSYEADAIEIRIHHDAELAEVCWQAKV